MACALNANTGLSANHAGPSVLIEKSSDRGERFGEYLAGFQNTGAGMVEPVRNSGDAEMLAERHLLDEHGTVCDVLVLNDQGGGIMSVSDKPATLRAQMKHHEPIVCFAVKTKQIDMRTADNETHPLDSNDDKEPQVVCYAIDHVVLGGVT